MTPLLWALSLPDADPLPLPAPVPLVRGLLLLTFFLHLLPMNLVLGGSLISIATRFTAHRDPAGHGPRVVTWFEAALPTLVAATITLGIAPLLFLQVVFGRAFFGSAILMAWPWLAVVPLLTVAYYASYRMAYTRGVHRVVLPLLATGIFVVISLLYSNNMSLMLRADRFAEFSAGGVSGWRLGTGDPTLVPRYLHVLLGAVAVAGAGLAALGLAWRRRDAAAAEWALRRGSAWVVAATLVGMAAGFWWLLALPREVLMRFMGRDALAAAALLAGVVLGMVAVGCFALAWRARRADGLVRGGIHALAATLVAMVITRDQVRESSLASIGLEPARWVETQWGPLLIFVVLLVGAILTVAWMVWLLTKAAPRPTVHADVGQETAAGDRR